MPTRRQFVQVTAAAGAATVLKTRGVLGANERINVGIIGCGGRGTADWQRFLKQPDVNIATRLGRSVRWDAVKEEFIGDADANRRLHYEYRKPWKL